MIARTHLHRPSQRRNARNRRSGFVLIALLAAFAITAALAGVWARTVVLEHRQTRLREERLQMKWLAEAGVRRAAAQLAANPAYTGETWQIAAAELSRPEAAVVRIRVEPIGAAGQLRLVARASYPRGSARVRETKQVVYNPQGESQP